MEPPTSSYPQYKFSSSRNSWPFTEGVTEEFRVPHRFPEWREGKQKEILFFFWGTDCYRITKASSWKDSSQEAPCLENGLDSLSFPGRLTPDRDPGWKWVILTAGLTAIIRCWSVLHTSLSVGSSCHSPEHVQEQLHSAVVSDERYLENLECKEHPQPEWLDVEWQR